MKLFYKILFTFLGKGLFSLPLHNPGRITSILTHINTIISELVFFTWGKARWIPDDRHPPCYNKAWVRARLFRLKKGCTRLATTSDKVLPSDCVSGLSIIDGRVLFSNVYAKLKRFGNHFEKKHSVHMKIS
jgi:hypothetical protein